MSTLRDGYMQGISNTDMVAAAKNQQAAQADAIANERVNRAAPSLIEQGRREGLMQSAIEQERQRRAAEEAAYRDMLNNSYPELLESAPGGFQDPMPVEKSALITGNVR